MRHYLGMATNSEMLTSVRTAIAAVLAGGNSSYSINGRTFTRLDLDTLLRMEKEYAGRVASENAVVRPMVVRFNEPS